VTIEIERCRLAYKCTQRWEALDPLPGTLRVRFCAKCQSAVHLAQTTAAFDELAQQGKCVAFQFDDEDIGVGAPRRRRSGDMIQTNGEGDNR
jgi:hypothetical protein